MDHLPIFLDVRNRKVVIDGGTTVAARRAERALAAGAEVHLFDPAPAEDEFRDLLVHARLHHHAREFRPEDIAGAVVAYGAAEDERRDRRLADAARAAGVLSNVADVPEYCDFITPSVVDRSPLVVAISSGGAAPIIARILRARIESQLPPAYGRMAEFMGRFRDRVMARLGSSRARRRFWERTIDGPAGDLFLAGDAEGAARHIHAELDADDGEAGYLGGEVYLVGAGPGDPDLLTFRALRLMQRADVVLYDRLVGKDILELVRRDAERIYVGKLPSRHTLSQEEIGALLVRLAKEGKRVLRLKGGDPFIFGRGGEEIETLAGHGIPFQVVPGITAAAGCASYAGIPLTHRDHAQACVFVTAHGRNGVLGLDWDVLLRPNQTVAVYMGLSSLDELSGQFVARGADPEMPAAIIDNGTRASQRVAVCTVGSLHETAMREGFEGPAMIIIGSVVELRDRLRWFSEHDQSVFSMGLTARESL